MSAAFCTPRRGSCLSSNDGEFMLRWRTNNNYYTSCVQMTNYDGHLSSPPNIAASPFELNTSLGMRRSVLVRDDEAVENLGDILQNFPYLKVRGLRYRIQPMPIISGVTSGGQQDGMMTKGDIITSVKVQLKGKRARHVKISDFKYLIKVLQDRKRIGEEEGYDTSAFSASRSGLGC